MMIALSSADTKAGRPLPLSQPVSLGLSPPLSPQWETPCAACTFDDFCLLRPRPLTMHCSMFIALFVSTLIELVVGSLAVYESVSPVAVRTEGFNYYAESSSNATIGGYHWQL
jgi:hypothetical protein